MSTVTAVVPAPVRSVSWFRPKYLLFGFIGLMLAYVLQHNERFLVDANNPAWKHFEPFKWWLLPHGLAAEVLLLPDPTEPLESEVVDDVEPEGD